MFSFSLVQAFIQPVKNVIAWKDPKSKRYFSFRKKKQVVFYHMEKIKEVIEDEWRKTDKKFSLG